MVFDNISGPIRPESWTLKVSFDFQTLTLSTDKMSESSPVKSRQQYFTAITSTEYVLLNIAEVSKHCVKVQ